MTTRRRSRTSPTPRSSGRPGARARRAASSLRPTKQRGQNFVVDANTVRRIVGVAGRRARRRRRRGRPGPGLADPGAAAEVARVVGRRGRPGARRPRCRRPSRRSPRSWPDRLDGRRAPTRCASTTLPGPPPTALVANLPYNVSVPVLLHLPRALPVAASACLVMVQAEVADRLAAGPAARSTACPAVKAAWYADVRCAGHGRPQRLLAGAQRRLRAGRLEPPRAAADDRRPRGGLRLHRRGVRPAPQDAAGGARRLGRRRRPGRGGAACRRHRPAAPAASSSTSTPSPRIAAACLRRRAVDLGWRMTVAPPYPAPVTVRVPAKVNLELLRRAAPRRRLPRPGDRLPGGGRLRRRHRRAGRRVAVVTVTGPYADRRPDRRRQPRRCGPRALLADAAGVDEPVHIRIDKEHPGRGRHGRRLGRRARRRWSPATSCGASASTADDLAELAADLGSDVPFVLAGGTAMGSGRGEQLAPVLGRGTYHWVFALSDIGLSTPGGVRRVRPAARRRPRARAPAVGAD